VISTPLAPGAGAARVEVGSAACRHRARAAVWADDAYPTSVEELEQRLAGAAPATDDDQSSSLERSCSSRTIRHFTR